MRLAVIVLALVTLIPCLAPAQPRAPRPMRPAPPPEGPQELGKFDDWIAATHEESGQATCYAFARPA